MQGYGLYPTARSLAHLKQRGNIDFKFRLGRVLT